MKNIPEKHKKRYIALTIIIFFLVAIFHGWRVANNLPFTVGEFDVPMSVSAIATLMLILMLVMGVTYLKK